MTSRELRSILKPSQLWRFLVLRLLRYLRPYHQDCDVVYRRTSTCPLFYLTKKVKPSRLNLKWLFFIIVSMTDWLVIKNFYGLSSVSIINVLRLLKFSFLRLRMKQCHFLLEKFVLNTYILSLINTLYWKNEIQVAVSIHHNWSCQQYLKLTYL